MTLYVFLIKIYELDSSRLLIIAMYHIYFNAYAYRELLEGQFLTIDHLVVTDMHNLKTEHFCFLPQTHASMKL